jgi:membrane fusion protein (multidrug efflux system)
MMTVSIPRCGRRAGVFLPLALALLLLSGCGDAPPLDEAAGRPGGPPAGGMAAAPGGAQGGPEAGRGAPGASGGRGGPGGPPLAVTTQLPERVSLGAEIEAVGTALANESVEITAKSTNRIEAIRFTEGQRVARGTVLVQLDRAQAAAELAEAEANLAEARRQLRRGQDLEVTQALSRAQLDQLQTAVTTAEARVAAARSRLDDTVIRAPFAGRTGFRRVSVGGLVNAGAVITTLDDASVIKLEFTVPQTFVGELAVGLPVFARVDGLGEREFQGRVATIDSRIDPVTRSIAVRAEIPNGDGTLKPGMFMSVRLRGRESPTLVLPEQAIAPQDGRSYVFVVEDGRALRREVRTGLRRPGLVAIVGGLDGDERVIVDGTFRARDGAPVIDTSAGAAPGGPAAAGRPAAQS